MPRNSSTNHKRIVARMMFLLLAQDLISWWRNAHVPTSRIPRISTKLPVMVCTITTSAGRVNGIENKPLKLSNEGIITTTIETVLNTTAMPINAPCFINPRLSLTTRSPTTRKIRIAIWNSRFKSDRSGAFALKSPVFRPQPSFKYWFKNP